MKMLVVGLWALAMAGCIVAPVSLSPSTVPLGKDDYTVIGPTNGRAFGMAFMGIPLSEPNPAGKARDRAINAGGGEALVDVAVDMTQIMLGPLTLVFTTVHGDAVSINR